ncbi:MAG: type I DNA topoisomerase [Clostridiaceae bacterium]|nr:type I DNA topoisomerase [Clostridiaceae bacterium]
MSKLVIVESPSKAKTIQKYLGKDYKVTASVGHVRDLPAAKLSVDIKNDFAPKYAIVKGKEKLVKELKGMVDESDKVYLATDPDREGEAISWHLATVLGLNTDELNRVKFNEINKQSVLKGIQNPEKIDMDLVDAQQARRILDRIVGYKLSPFVSQKIRRGLSAGRVQSVAVRLIVDRENEIRNFNAEEYWTIDAKLIAPSSKRAFTATLTADEKGKAKIENKEQSDAYLARLDGADYIVDSVKKGTRKRQPAPPFTTSTLQQEASRKLNFQAQRTMKIAQELYEGMEIKGEGTMGLITYMRTDSLRISEESRAAGNEYILSNYGKSYLPEKPRYYKTKASAQDGHEAIRPTNPLLDPEKVKDSLTTEQYKLYSLIWKRFMASLMAACVQDTVKVDVSAATAADRKNGKFCMFTANGYNVKFDGYTRIYEVSTDEEEETESVLPEMKDNDALKLKALDGNQHFTQPPARFTEASLIKELEETGVGRPSTYVSIVSTILNREYVEREKKQLKPTELGEAVTGLLKKQFPNIVNVKFTASMESDLDKVESGEVDYIAMLHSFYDGFENTLEKAKADMSGVKIQLQEDVTDIPCEKCGRMMVVKVGRFGKFLACPGYPECKNTKPFVVQTNAKCPVCGGKVIEKKSRKGYTFYGCDNYPECNFMTWDKPTDEICPNCGKSLFKRKGGLLVCLNEGCGYEKKAERKKRTKKED